MAEVNLNDISSNSDAARAADQGKSEDTDAVQYEPLKKRNPLIRLIEFFGINTDLDGVGGAIWQDVIVPTFLDGCRDSLYAITDSIFGGGGGASRKNSQGNKRQKSGYTNYSAKSTSKQPNRQPNVNSYFLEYDERTSDDPDNPGAQDVLDQMRDVVDTCGAVSIQDMITISKKTTSNYTLGDWGWTDLSRVMVRTTAGRKFKIDLPKPVYLKEE